jgi:hypothetical protein
MTKYGFIVAGVTGLVASLLSGQASAAPTCTSTITITTITSEADSTLGAGVCVAAGDKIFGNFNFSTLNQTGGSVLFTPPSPLTTPFIGNYELTFTNLTLANTTVSNFGFEVAVTTPAVSLIDDLEKDLTLAATPIITAAATATLTGTVNVPQIPLLGISCTRTVNPTTSTCPGAEFFGPVADVIVRNTLITGPNTNVSAVFDTISEIRVTTPEPASLALLGSAVLGLGWFTRRRNKRA